MLSLRFTFYPFVILLIRFFHLVVYLTARWIFNRPNILDRDVLTCKMQDVTDTYEFSLIMFVGG